MLAAALAPPVGAAALAACGLFGSNSAYTQPVTAAAVDRDSARYVQSMGAAGSTSGFDGGASRRDDHRYERDAHVPRASEGAVPQSSAPSPILGARLSDRAAERCARHRRADPDCRLYELVQSRFTAQRVSAYSGAVLGPREPFVPLPPGSPSAMASGLSLYAGTARWEEIAAALLMR